MSRLRLLRDPGHFLALGGGLGLMPVAPGTFGTLPGFALVLALRPLASMPAVLLLVAGFAAGAWLARRTAFALRQQDPGAVVCDEYLAFAGLLYALPADLPTLTWAFLLFRLFDATKPFPVGYADRHVHGGTGIMLDDVLAAALAWLACRGLALLHLPGGPLS